MIEFQLCTISQHGHSILSFPPGHNQSLVGCDGRYCRSCNVCSLCCLSERVARGSKIALGSLRDFLYGSQGIHHPQDQTLFFSYPRHSLDQSMNLSDGTLLLHDHHDASQLVLQPAVRASDQFSHGLIQRICLRRMLLDVLNRHLKLSHGCVLDGLVAHSYSTCEVLDVLSLAPFKVLLKNLQPLPSIFHLVKELNRILYI
mmetsp:Transcript_12054/g.41899  ORF Transcript_12054/g.41899 Transcript_12054/m.41899 type:complete len:201 (-) Transcript_12054:1439-2041(-)